MRLLLIMYLVTILTGVVVAPGGDVCGSDCDACCASQSCDQACPCDCVCVAQPLPPAQAAYEPSLAIDGLVPAQSDHFRLFVIDLSFDLPPRSLSF